MNTPTATFTAEDLLKFTTNDLLDIIRAVIDRAPMPSPTINLFEAVHTRMRGVSDALCTGGKELVEQRRRTRQLLEIIDACAYVIERDADLPDMAKMYRSAAEAVCEGKS